MPAAGEDGHHQPEMSYVRKAVQLRLRWSLEGSET
jgi:hypothetical protein